MRDFQPYSRSSCTANLPRREQRRSIDAQQDQRCFNDAVLLGMSLYSWQLYRPYYRFSV